MVRPRAMLMVATVAAIVAQSALEVRAWLAGMEDVGWTPTRVSDSQRFAYDDVRTVVGQSTLPGTADGNETGAHLNAPAAVAVRNDTSLFVAEHGNHAIRIVTIHNPVVAWKDYPIYYKTCAEIRRFDESAKDGQYQLYFNGERTKPYTVWCEDMDVNPREYIYVSNSSNYARYTCGGGLDGYTAVTGFHRLRYNVTASAVIVDDYSFVHQWGTCRLTPTTNADIQNFTSTNATECGMSGLCGPYGKPLLRYGMAGGCTKGGDKITMSRMDFNSTPWAISADTHWEMSGYLAASDVTFDGFRKSAVIYGGGVCGWNQVTAAGLKLDYVEPWVENEFYVKKYSIGTFVGLKEKFGAQDGVGTHARFMWPSSMAYNKASQELYVADTGNHAIRKVDAAGTVTTYAGTLMVSGEASTSPVSRTNAKLCSPYGLALHNDGSLYFSEFCNHVIRKIAPDGTVTIIAGTNDVIGAFDGTGANARFHGPADVALNTAQDVLYVADYDNHAIRKIGLTGAATGVVTTIAGHLNISGYRNSDNKTDTNTYFNHPTGLAIDHNRASLYVSEFDNHVLREIKIGGPEEGQVFFHAGGPLQKQYRDQVNDLARFNRPRGMAVASNGDLFVADFDNHAIRVVTDRPCPLKSKDLCSVLSSAASRALYGCNGTDWQVMKEAEKTYAASRLVGWGTPAPRSIRPQCQASLELYCKYHGLKDKACNLVTKSCPTSNASAALANGTNVQCSGHGYCDNRTDAVCTCYKTWFKQAWQWPVDNDCSYGVCPGDSTCNPPNGHCNRDTGLCVCDKMAYGAECQYRHCPNDCSGNGECDALAGRCGCYYPWAGPRCDYNTLFPHPVDRIKEDSLFDVFNINFTHATRWDLYNIEVTGRVFDPLLNQEFGLALMKERQPATVPPEAPQKPVWSTEKAPQLVSMFTAGYPQDHVLWRTLSVCPTDIRLEDPRHVWKIGVFGKPKTHYQLQFRITESLIPLNKYFQIETYGKRYLYYIRTRAHQRSFSFMWLDIHVEAGRFDNIQVMRTICPKAGVVPLKELKYDVDTTWATQWKQNGTAFRIELFSCGDQVGEYFVAIDTRGAYFRGTGYAYILENDHRCVTIEPPFRQEVLVTLGQVVRLAFPVVIGFVVFVFLAVRIGRYCYVQRTVAARHKERLEKERYDALAAADYFGEEQPDESMPEVLTKKVRKATSNFEARKAREKRLEAEVMRAQIEAEGLLRGEEKAVY